FSQFYTIARESQDSADYSSYVYVQHEGPICDLWLVPLIDVGYLHLVMTNFSDNNGRSLITRAHQLLMEGFNWWHVMNAHLNCSRLCHRHDWSVYLIITENNVVTVFSAPNYCYRRDTADPKTYTTATDQHGKENQAGLLNKTESFSLSPS
ncbi:hypothetical protein HID58_033824, partial [Brassica napus]